jgi:hypothetical protein
MKQPLHILTILSTLTLLLPACNKIKSKTQELADKTEQKVKDKSKDLPNQIIPHFDAYTPDTKFNKERFKDFLQVELTPDVKNIYCFDDAIGIDADYQFSFNCDSSTARRIIEKHNLSLDKETTDYAFGMQNDFPWWDKKKIEKLDLYSWKGERQYYQYFWYDAKEQKAYYFDFDL